MNRRDLISVIDHESELLAALSVWARDKTMGERAAKIRRMTIAIGKVPLWTGDERRVREAGTSRLNDWP